MIIDAILDRKDLEADGYGDTWTETERDYLLECAEFSDFDYIVVAFKTGNNSLVQAALCFYLDQNNYNPDIRHYIQAKNWII